MFGSGAFGGDLLSEYMTDSTNFRVYIGPYDDAIGNYSYRCEKTMFLYKGYQEKTPTV